MMTKKTLPVPAFQQVELQSRPIYLGFCNKDESYWFYAIKEMVPRFLRFVTYFHWDRGPQDILEMKPLPEEVELELQQFLEGKLGYEFRKKRKNSKENTAFKIYRTPEEFGAEDERQSRGHVKRVNVPPSGDPNPGGSLPRHTSARGNDESNACLPRRSTRRLGHAKSSERTAERIVSSSDLAVTEVEVLPESKPETPEPRRRGRPPKNQVVETTITAISSKAVLETKKVTNDTKNKPQQKSDGLELGVVGLLKDGSPTVRKRGRPRKVL